MRVCFTRQFLLLGVIVSLSVLGGCDAVKEIVDDTTGGNKPPIVAAPTQQPAQPQVVQPDASQQAQPPAPVDPRNLLADFQTLKPFEINDLELSKIADVPEAAAQIVEIDMTGSQVSAAGINVLTKFPNLKSVTLNSAASLKGGEFQGLENVGTLEAVHLDSTLMDTQDLAAVTRLPGLRILTLKGIRGVPADGFAALQNAKRLSVLDISTTFSGDTVAPILATLPITKLDIYATAFSDLGLAQVASIPTLQELNASFTQVTGDGFKAFRNRGLRSLSVAETNFGVVGLQAIKGMKELEYLNLYKCNVAGTLPQMNVFGGFPKLTYLNLGNNGISDLGVKELFSRCRQLETLVISHHPAVSDAGLQFLQNHKNLKELNIRETSCSQQGADFMKSKIPGLVVVFN